MPPFSFVIVIIICYFFIRCDRKMIFSSLLAWTSFAELFLTAGYFCHIGSYEFKYSEFLCLVLIMYLLYIFCRYQVDSQWIMYILFFLTFIIVNNFLIFIAPYGIPTIIYGGQTTWDSFCLYGESLELVRFSWQVILMDIRYMLFLFIAMISLNCFDDICYQVAIKKFIVLGYLMFAIVMFEFCLGIMGYGANFVAYRDWIMGIGDSTAGYFLRSGRFTLAGATLEPGHLARAIWVWLIVYIVYIKKPSYFIILLATIIMLLSGSLAAVLYAASIVMILSVLRLGLKNFIIVLCVASLSFILFFISCKDLFQNNMQRIMAILSYMTDGSMHFIGSEGIRIISIVSLFEAFLKRPFFGIGIGTAYSYGGFVDLMATLGSIGTCLYLYICKVIVSNNKNWNMLVVQLVILLSCCLVGGINMFYSTYTFIVLLSMRLYSSTSTI